MSSKAPSAPPPATRYLAAVDTTAAASEVVRVAAGLARGLSGPAEVHVLHVIAMPVTEGVPAFPSAQDLLQRGRSLVDRAVEEAKFEGRCVGHIAVGEASHEILEMAESLKADVIVVGTSEKNAVSRMLLGSVAEKVVRHAHAPVLVVRPKSYKEDVSTSIAPPCPDCVKIQEETNREKLWCAQHEKRHPHGRLHYEIPQSFGRGSMLIRPS